MVRRISHFAFRRQGPGAETRSIRPPPSSEKRDAKSASPLSSSPAELVQVVIQVLRHEDAPLVARDLPDEAVLLAGGGCRARGGELPDDGGEARPPLPDVHGAGHA